MSGISLFRELAVSWFSALGLIPLTIVAGLALGACSDDDTDSYVTYDDFTGTDGDAPSAGKWDEILSTGSSLSISSNALSVIWSADGNTSNRARLIMADAGSPTTTTGIEAKMTADAWSVSAGDVRLRVGGRFYNDGTLTGAADSPVSDIWTRIQAESFSGGTGLVTYGVWRCTDSTCSAFDTIVSAETLTTVDTGSQHTYRISYDSSAHIFTYTFDSTTTTIDMTGLGAPYVSAPNNPGKQVGVVGSGTPSGNITATIDDFRCTGCVVP